MSSPGSHSERAWLCSWPHQTPQSPFTGPFFRYNTSSYLILKTAHFVSYYTCTLTERSPPQEGTEGSLKCGAQEAWCGPSEHPPDVCCPPPFSPRPSPTPLPVRITNAVGSFYASRDQRVSFGRKTCCLKAKWSQSANGLSCFLSRAPEQSPPPGGRWWAPTLQWLLGLPSLHNMHRWPEGPGA